MAAAAAPDGPAAALKDPAPAPAAARRRDPMWISPGAQYGGFG